MKQVGLLFILSFSSFGCSKESCDEQVAKANVLYIQGIKNCNGASACSVKMTADYNKKLAEIFDKCN